MSRFRINDSHPYIYRTHDGGKTWTVTTAGLPDFGAVDTVREDPVRKGLLFAGTENAVWVSFDDGDHWQSLQLNLPHTSMRDLWIHDDDLIVATHGRSFWILDDIAPLREASASFNKFRPLFTPAPACRVQRDTYTDTPLPPDEPVAENPPDGAIIDYFLPTAASGPVALEILDAQGKLVRRFASDDKPDVTEEELQKQMIPLYWIRPERHLSADAGMHRWVWDLHHPPPVAAHHEFPISAIPHDTPRYPLGPTVLPGAYSVRLTVEGKTQSAPLTIKMDPRVKTPPLGLEKKFQSETRLASILSESSQAVFQAGSLRDQLEKVDSKASSASSNGPDKGVDRDEKSNAAKPTTLRKAETKDAIAAFQKKLTALLGGSGSSEAADSQEVTLTSVNRQAGGLYGQVWQVDAEPTIPQQEAQTAIERTTADVLKRWNELKTTDLPALDRRLKEWKIPELRIDSSRPPEEFEGDEE